MEFCALHSSLAQAQAMLDQNQADQTKTNSTHLARDHANYDFADLSLLMVVNHSSTWKFQPVVEGATNSDINISVDVSFVYPGQYLRTW
jgi:Tfp pilus assembly protein PilV